MSLISIPQSVLSYSNNEGVRVAVDHLVNADPSDFPSEIASWEEARNYHKALLSAHQVQAERAMLLIDLWDAVWGDLVKQRDYSRLMISYQQQHSEEHFDLEFPSPYALWNDSAIHTRMMKHPVLPNTVVYLGTRYLGVGIQLYLSVENDDEVLSTGLSLPHPWAADEDEDGFRHTVEDYLHPSETEVQTDLAPLKEAAGMALDAVEPESA
jgi:hypothetical protein